MIENNYYKEIINTAANPNMQIKKRVLVNGKSKIMILFIEQLIDKLSVSTDIIKPLSIFIANNKKITSDEAFDSVLYASDCYNDNDENRIIGYILSGMTVVLFLDEKKYLYINIKKIQSRPVSTPELNFTLRGPIDCFTENLDVNLSLIRYRIKDPKLIINKIQLGKRTKTDVVILYIEDIANENTVKELTDKVGSIDVDGIIDTGEIQNMILNKRLNFFPQAGIVERSDHACRMLLEGKIVVLSDGSSLGLIVPQTFGDFFAACDDVYDNKYFGTFMKIVRMYATFFSFSITAVYVAILSFHIDDLPIQYIISIRDSREGVPFVTFIGALILESIIELLREALLRIPKQIGPGVGIVGGIVIGQSAIAAKSFSPLLLIIVALSLLSSFVVPDYTIMNSLRIIKFFLILVSGMFGLIGFALGFSIIAISLVSNSSFGVPYTSPLAPFNWYDFKTFFFTDKKISPLRTKGLRTKDSVRMPINKK